MQPTQTITSALALAALWAASGTALAQAKAPEPDYTLSFNVAAVSDYRFRGIAQTSKKPAAQAGVDFAHKSGVYLGAFASNVSWVKDFNGATKGSYELDLYGGFKTEIAKDTTLDLGAITYRYPGNNSGDRGTPGAGMVGRADTNEIYAGVTYGTFTAKINRTTGNLLGFLDSAGSTYIDLSMGIDLGNGMTLTPHIGHQTVKNNGAYSYTDYALTLARDLGNGVTLSAAAIGTSAKKASYTDIKGRFIGNNTLVLGAKYAF